MSVSDDVKMSISDAVNQGKVVTIPETNFQYNLWYGVGWIVEDPLTGAGAYQISGFLMGGETTQNRTCPPSSPPSCTEVENYLADDTYRAIAYHESAQTWAQFNSEGEPLTHVNRNKSVDVGIMQINSTWKDGPWPGKTELVDWKKVQCDWKYNVDLGKAIYDYAKKFGNQDLINAGITNPTEEQILQKNKSYRRTNKIICIMQIQCRFLWEFALL